MNKTIDLLDSGEYGRALEPNPLEVQLEDDFYPEFDFSQDCWAPISDISLPDDARIVLPYGKYAADLNDAYAVLGLPNGSTLTDAYRVATNHLLANDAKVLDGKFLLGFDLTDQGALFAYFEA
jgi:hypothetical protein